MLRREQIKLQVALITPLMHVKGATAPESKAAAERARLLVEQAEALGEPPDDPLILFSVLYAFWNAVPFNGDVCRGLAAQFLALAAKQQTTAPRLIGHRIMGHTLFHTGEFVEAKAHFDKGLALYNAAEHRPLATRFWIDSRIMILCYRSLAAWVLGYPCGCDLKLKPSGQRCARHRPSGLFDVRAWLGFINPYLLWWKLRNRNRAR